jgi:hypothetical protein
VAQLIGLEDLFRRIVLLGKSSLHAHVSLVYSCISEIRVIVPTFGLSCVLSRRSRLLEQVMYYRPNRRGGAWAVDLLEMYSNVA